MVESTAESQHDGIPALAVEIGAAPATIVSCKRTCLLCRRHDSKSQSEGKNAKRRHAEIIRSLCTYWLN